MVIFYIIVLIALSLYSYTLIDLNLTLFNGIWWAHFREWIIQLGYFHRDVSWYIYVAFIVALFAFHFYFVKHFRKISLKYLLLGLFIVGVFSYPFISHDFFNYMFDAKILTHYHMNPYLKRGLDFPHDPWLRFMQWTHRPYPYGPTFLPLTLIPSSLSFGKLLLNFLFFKLFFFFFFCVGVFALSAQNKKWAIIFATHPLVIIEGIVNSHNDIVAVGLALVALYYISRDKKWMASIFFLLSGGIKYITLPLILYGKKNKILSAISIMGVIALLVYLSLTSEVQPWYFLNLFIFIPMAHKWITRLWIFFLGLLLSYYPFIFSGDWKEIYIKHALILIALGANIVVPIFLHHQDTRGSFSKGASSS